MNIVLQISYDGTDFFGWQKTREGPSIEESLENALRTLLGTAPSLQAASRTDRGVHARGQIVNFHIETLPLPLARLPLALNRYLPHTLRIQSAALAPDTFHPTLDAHSKTYLYQIDNAPVASPFLCKTHWHLHTPLDWDAMARASGHLIGRHDFSAFTSELRGDPIRHVTAIDISPGCIAVTGTSFLYKMVRTLAGTLVDVGRGRLQASDLPAILTSKKRARAGVTAPAHGLTLDSICYEHASCATIVP